MVSMLLEKGADINAAGGKYGSSLQGAAAGGHTELVGMLLEKVAAARGHTEIVGILLENGAYVMQQGENMGAYCRLLLLEATQRLSASFLKRGLTSMQQEANMGAHCRLLLSLLPTLTFWGLGQDRVVRGPQALPQFLNEAPH
ncbi:hypothetical protein K438DRAFT_1775148 [Mycena galopus ATCC 62051]|nr:hypothetical protein K438DRAFT_1775148 [Mycena galopus ATCC 62051]